MYTLIIWLSNIIFLIATVTDQKQDEAENVATMIFRDPVRKEPSLRIKKDHPWFHHR